ncbi:MAG TPA: adenylate kinase [Candidatus Binatia bacterium]|nr:adenylate kinase [Candidatus Binatia bacterium]
MRVVLLGAPGAGKGTQANLLHEKFGACQVSTGDLLRKAVADQTTLGNRAAEYIRRGALVPDDLIVDLVRERLKGKDCDRGFVLDGFPRTIPQAQSLQEILKEMGSGLDRVLSIQVPRSVILERLSGRRTCKQCGSLYHLLFDRPKKETVCDRCGGELYQREDDREETINTRLNVYETQTAPLINFYREKGRLREIDGTGKADSIHRRVLEALGDLAE